MSETDTVFKYDQLGKRAKERAREWLSGCIRDGWEPNYDDVQECLACLGFTLHREDFKTAGGRTMQRPAISYSIGWVQSDYASFSADWEAEKLDGERLAGYAPQDETLRRAYAHLMAVMLAHPQASAVVRMNSSNRGSAHSIEEPRCFPGGDDDPYIETALHGIVNDLAHWLYEHLRDDLEWQTSDEAVEESIEANEYDFDEDGGRV